MPRTSARVSFVPTPATRSRTAHGVILTLLMQEKVCDTAQDAREYFKLIEQAGRSVILVTGENSQGVRILGG